MKTNDDCVMAFIRHDGDVVALSQPMLDRLLPLLVLDQPEYECTSKPAYRLVEGKTWDDVDQLNY